MSTKPPYPAQSPLKTAFTLVELLTTLAILALLITMMVPFIGNYVSQARATSDKQTLQVLNDAINRYKMQGGDIAALTAGKAYPNLISALKAPIGWQGLSHQFLRDSNNLSAATTIAATGSGRSYRLTSFNSYTSEFGSPAPLSAAPAWGGILAQGDFTNVNTNLHTLTLTAGAPVGARAVFFLRTQTDISGISSVIDSKGHTYTLDAGIYQVNGRLAAIYGAFLTSPLEVGDTITLTYNNTFYHSEAAMLGFITGVSNVGTAVTSGSYSSSYILSPTATAAPCIVLYQGNITTDYTPVTLTSGTEIARVTYDTDRLILWAYRTSSSSGAISVGYTLSGLATSTRCAVAYW